MAAPFHYNRSGCVRKRQSQLQRPDVCFADLTYSSAIR